MTDRNPARGPRSRDAILQAAGDLCREQGYAAVTMEAIATRARVGKPTLYRWWPSKGAVFLDVVLDRIVEPAVQLPDTGDIARDLRTWIRGFADLFTDPHARQLLVGLLGAAQTDAELATMLREKIQRPLQASNRERITAAQSAGQLPAMDPVLLEELLISPPWYRLLVSGEPVTPAYADALVDAVLGAHGGSSR
ncbi:TetR/AcrR family transcriptional regulator [Streptantibioticus cattleyicolor]|uniref:TetR/AcrR family transcriptional regulator n=1 Tax=Streptantibioticus cattleyicolor TaxID=29303 RepID=UPI000213E712|nr:TetR/AcrR family transcriptional regulator [Streptantibioticus cattleyicolor]CCB71231.1 putative transcriptional regulator [Streptantibioticus cattleyicolor NRRL 8057 = DSM 46488]